MAGNPLQEYEGMDGIVGRPIRLNVQTLKPRHGKRYAELMFWGDVHDGYPQCELEKAKEALRFAMKRGIYVLCQGDLIEAGLRDSVGDSCYRQRLNPQAQMEEMIEILEPVARAGLVIGLHTGNHEARVTKTTSIDVAKIMAKTLRVPYLNFACWSLLKVGSQRYSLYSQHGKGGSRFKHSKLKLAMDQLAWIGADIVAVGHVHAKTIESSTRQVVRRGRVLEEKCLVVLTGSYISWDRSYAQAEMYPLGETGSPCIRLYADHKETLGTT